MIAIVDYGVGNLFSLRSSLQYLGADVTVTGDADVLGRADQVILPGVGAFADAAAKLRSTGLDQVVIEAANSGKPLLGICLGMQLLLERSFEYGEHPGLGLVGGEVAALREDLDDPALKVPHMGWNRITTVNPSPLLQEADGKYVYFVHSFHAVPDDPSIVTSVCDYGTQITASVGQGSVQGFQFHPEKSSFSGLAMLQAFKEWKL